MLTLDAEDDGVGVLHVGLADAEDGFLCVGRHACGHRL